MERTNIEWADSTFNPVTGCYNTCEYCYARRIATRFKGYDASPEGNTVQKIVDLNEPLIISSKDGNKPRNAAYPFGFTPTFHRYRLDQFNRLKFGETIFMLHGRSICSVDSGRMDRSCIPDLSGLSEAQVSVSHQIPKAVLGVGRSQKASRRKKLLVWIYCYPP